MWRRFRSAGFMGRVAKGKKILRSAQTVDFDWTHDWNQVFWTDKFKFEVSEVKNTQYVRLHEKKIDACLTLSVKHGVPQICQ